MTKYDIMHCENIRKNNTESEITENNETGDDNDYNEAGYNNNDNEAEVAMALFLLGQQ